MATLLVDSDNIEIVRKEFQHIQDFLLLHKYLYYVNNESCMPDNVFDNCERYSLQLAKRLGFRADKSKGPDQTEHHHIHWMVGFDQSNIYWMRAQQKYKNLIK